MMAFTQGQLDALEAAISKGARVVQYDGRRVEYHTIAEMMALRDQMRRELASAAGRRRSPFVRLFHGGKGI